MMYDVVTFGEAMLRLSPPHFARLEQTHALDRLEGFASHFGADFYFAVPAGTDRSL